MGRDACQAFEHLVARQHDATLRKEEFGQFGRPDRVRMQDRSRPTLFRDRDVQHRFRG